MSCNCSKKIARSSTHIRVYQQGDTYRGPISLSPLPLSGSPSTHRKVFRDEGLFCCTQNSLAFLDLTPESSFPVSITRLTCDKAPVFTHHRPVWPRMGKTFVSVSVFFEDWSLGNSRWLNFPYLEAKALRGASSYVLVAYKASPYCPEFQN